MLHWCQRNPVRDFLENHSPEEGVSTSDHGSWDCCEVAGVAFGDLGCRGVGSEGASREEFRPQELCKQDQKWGDPERQGPQGAWQGIE